MLNEKRTSHELIRFTDRDERYLYSYEYDKRSPSSGNLYRLDFTTRDRLPNAHEAQLDPSGVWYIYSPNGDVIDSLDNQYFDPGDISYILARFDRKNSKSVEEYNFLESIYNHVKNFSSIKETYIWSVLLSDEDIHDFQGDTEDELRDKVTKYCLDNDLKLVNLLNVKHVRKDRFMDPEYLKSIEESYDDYELSWIEKTRNNRSIIKTRGFRNIDDLNKFRNNLSFHPKFVKFLTIMDPDGTSYLQEDQQVILLKTSKSDRYKLFRDYRDGTLKVLDDKTHTYVNYDLSSEEDFESWEDD